jgi:hypothetical protein
MEHTTEPPGQTDIVQSRPNTIACSKRPAIRTLLRTTSESPKIIWFDRRTRCVRWSARMPQSSNNSVAALLRKSSGIRNWRSTYQSLRISSQSPKNLPPSVSVTMSAWTTREPPNRSFPAGAIQASVRARQARADVRATRLAPFIAELRVAGVTTLKGIAAALNERGVPPPSGHGRWGAMQVSRPLKRLAGLRCSTTRPSKRNRCKATRMP